MMTTQMLLHRLKQMVAQLTTSLESVPQEENASRRFNHQLFQCRGNRLKDYQAEITGNLQQLERLVAAHQTEQIVFITDKLVAQLSALQREIATLALRHQESSITPEQNADRHQRLVQYRQYEQRLQEMIEDREQLLQQIQPFAQQKQTEREIAALYGRLQRCRGALRNLEQEIEQQEASHYDFSI